MAGQYNIQVNQGEDYVQLFQWKMLDSDTPFNLTGFTARAQIRSAAFSNGIIATIAVAITDAVNGVFKLSLSNTVTASIPTGQGKFFYDEVRYPYDVELVSPAGAVSRVLNGSVIISPEVTR